MIEDFKEHNPDDIYEVGLEGGRYKLNLHLCLKIYYYYDILFGPILPYGIIKCLLLTYICIILKLLLLVSMIFWVKFLIAIVGLSLYT